MDALRQAFVDHTLEASLHAANKAAASAAFAKITPDKPLDPDAKARKAAADKRKAESAAASAARATPTTKPCDTTRPPPKKMMVGTAAPIHAPRHPPSYAIAYDEDGGSGGASV
jgi:septal ring factor EnvC (AmiA/AmiB activator)